MKQLKKKQAPGTSMEYTSNHPPTLQLQRQVVIGFVFVTTPLQ